VFRNETHSHKGGIMQKIEFNDSQLHSHFENYTRVGVPNIQNLD
jgi:hypothetical protein